MKKISLMTFALLLAMILSTGAVFADTNSKTVNLVIGQSTAQINGQTVTMTAPAQVVSGRTLVPLRFIGEAFGCDVAWDNSTKSANVTLESQTIQVPIGQNYVVINGENTAIEVPGQLINGSTYVPLRFIGENLGAEVTYDTATKGISILMNTYQNKTLGFETALPTGWIVEEEAAEDVTLSCGDNYLVNFSKIDNKDGLINVLNFKAFAEETFKEFSDQKEFTSTVEDNGYAYCSYVEDGMACIVVCRLLDNSIGVFAAGSSLGTFDDATLMQVDLIVNTFKAI